MNQPFGQGLRGRLLSVPYVISQGPFCLGLKDLLPECGCQAGAGWCWGLRRVASPGSSSYGLSTWPGLPCSRGAGIQGGVGWPRQRLCRLLWLCLKSHVVSLQQHCCWRPSWSLTQCRGRGTQTPHPHGRGEHVSGKYWFWKIQSSVATSLKTDWEQRLCLNPRQRSLLKRDDCRPHPKGGPSLI